MENTWRPFLRDTGHFLGDDDGWYELRVDTIPVDSSIFQIIVRFALEINESTQEPSKNWSCITTHTHHPTNPRFISDVMEVSACISDFLDEYDEYDPEFDSLPDELNRRLADTGSLNYPKTQKQIYLTPDF